MPWALGGAATGLRSADGLVARAGSAGAVASKIVPGSASGAQNTEVSVAAKSGRTGKSHTPAQPRQVRQMSRIARPPFDLGIIALVSSVAAQPLPGKIDRKSPRLTSSP